MRSALYPGTFDPVTIGHLDVVERAGRIFDRLIVGVGDNPEKACVFSLAERLRMMRREVAHLKNVEVKPFRGLMADFAKAEKVSVVLRGIRTVSDLEYEIQVAFTNRSSAGIETIFIAPRPEHAFINARFIKEIARGGGRVGGMVSPAVEAALRARLRSSRRARGRAGKGRK
jgi:pantetheine-phosphate adenylyltransferase